MELVSGILRLGAVVVLAWSTVSILVALPVAALFRAQARLEERWRIAERRRVWLESAR